MSNRRMDAPDTIDSAIHYLSKLQSEGWAIVRIEHMIDYESTGKKSRKLPVSATLTVELIPA